MNPEFTIGILVIAQGVLSWMEAKHDYHVIKASMFAPINQRSNYHNRQWHKWDAITWTLIYSTMALAAMEPILILTGLSWRFSLFPIVLNRLRGKKASYLGTGTIDALCNKTLKPLGTLILKIILILTLISYATFKVLQGVL